MASSSVDSMLRQVVVEDLQVHFWGQFLPAWINEANKRFKIRRRNIFFCSICAVAAIFVHENKRFFEKI